MFRSFVIKYTPTCVEKTGELIIWVEGRLKEE